MTRADAWILFAAAALSDPGTNVGESSDVADSMLEEFDARFEPVGRISDRLASPDNFRAVQDAENEGLPAKTSS